MIIEVFALLMETQVSNVILQWDLIFTLYIMYYVGVYIEFLTEFGDLPLLKSNAEGIINISPALGDGNSKFVMNITEVQKGVNSLKLLYFYFTIYFLGTKEDVECSSQGICDERRGICECSPYYTSSNGTTFQAGERFGYSVSFLFESHICRF